jgi:hypothetical protein
LDEDGILNQNPFFEMASILHILIANDDAVAYYSILKNPRMMPEGRNHEKRL